VELARDGEALRKIAIRALAPISPKSAFAILMALRDCRDEKEVMRIGVFSNADHI
jgi:hypothetical protein